MRYSDFDSIYHNLNLLVEKELKAAIKANGGEVVLANLINDYDYDVEKYELPLIIGYTRRNDTPQPYCVVRMEVTEYDQLIIYGTPSDYTDDEKEIEPMSGEIRTLFDYLPQPDQSIDVRISGLDDLNEMLKQMLNRE